MAIKKILITPAGRMFYVKDLTKDFHTQYGFVSSSQLKKAKPGSIVRTNLKKEFRVISPAFIDFYRKIKRVPQITPLKDIGAIITETGIGKESRIVDAGAGSGGLACFLANIAKEVTTYEIREDFAKIVEGNIKLLGLKNIMLKRKNIYDGIDETGLDLVSLDVPEPWKVVRHAATALKVGGFLVSFSPTVPQTMDFVAELRASKKFAYLKTLEVIEREWDVIERKVRPRSAPIGHSGFLTFARRIK